MCYHHFWWDQYYYKNAWMLSASLIQLEYASKQWKSTFSYSPLVLWWPPLSHFRKKGIFLGLSLLFTSTLKYLQFPSH